MEQELVLYPVVRRLDVFIPHKPSDYSQLSPAARDGGEEGPHEGWIAGGDGWL